MLITLRTKKSSFAAVSFAALLLACTPASVLANHACSATAHVVAPGAPTVSSGYSQYLTLTNAAWVVFFVSLVRFWTREGDAKPSRFNLDELIAGDNVAYNLGVFIDDEIIGHQGKKPYAMIDEEKGRLQVSTPCWPKGVYGWAAYYFKPVLSAIGSTAFIYLVCKTATDPRTKTEGFISVFGKRINECTGLSIKVDSKMTELGFGVALNKTGSALAPAC